MGPGKHWRLSHAKQKAECVELLDVCDPALRECENSPDDFKAG